MSKDFNKIAAELGELVTAKNQAYGDSFAKCGEFLRLLYPDGITPPQYDDAMAMVRIFDKQMRIATRKDAFGESPYRDITGYGLLGVAKDEQTAPAEPPPVEKLDPSLCESCATSCGDADPYQCERYTPTLDNETNESAGGDDGRSK